MITEAGLADEANNFVEHVKKMHKERDKGFEEEFKVNETANNYIIIHVNHYTYTPGTLLTVLLLLSSWRGARLSAAAPLVSLEIAHHRLRGCSPRWRIVCCF